MYNLIINTKLSKNLPFYIEDLFYSLTNKKHIKLKELKKFHRIGIEGNIDIKVFPIIKPKLIFKKIGNEFLLNLSTHIKEKSLLTDFLDLISAYIHTTNMIGYIIAYHDHEPEFPNLIFGNSGSSIKIIDITNNFTKTGIDYLSTNAFPSLLSTNLYKDK